MRRFVFGFRIRHASRRRSWCWGARGRLAANVVGNIIELGQVGNLGLDDATDLAVDTYGRRLDGVVPDFDLLVFFSIVVGIVLVAPAFCFLS